MDRPTAGDVEWFLTMHDGRDCDVANAECVLAAEVIALRLENAELTKQNAYVWSDGFNSASAGLAENEQEELLAPYKATLARVSALPAKWMDYALFDTGNVADCARDLEEALRQP